MPGPSRATASCGQARRRLHPALYAANVSNHGIFVVCTSGKKKGWRTVTGGELNFERMIEHLADHAQKVLTVTPSIVDLRVVPLDLG